MASALCSTKGRDQLAGAELVADLLHGRQQHVVEHANCVLAQQAIVDQCLKAILFAMQNLPVQGLFAAHTGRGVFHFLTGEAHLVMLEELMKVARAFSSRLKMRSSASSRCCCGISARA